MPRWRRRLGCRRREVVTMTTVSCVLVLGVYCLALTWCLAAPPDLLTQDEVDRPIPQNPDPAHIPGIPFRKLHYSLQRGVGGVDKSSQRRAGDNSGNQVVRHHRTLQFSGKDVWDSGQVSNLAVNANHRPVRTMQQAQSAAPSDSPSAIYLDGDSEEGYAGWGSPRGQEYQEGPGSPLNATLKRRLPGAIIIGVKKAGTRALLEFLRIHPDVQAPGPEPHFFDRNYNKGLDWYRSLMPASNSGQLTMEKTPSYFITREVPKRVLSMGGGVKLLVVVRDPVTRAISDYVQASSKRDGKMKPFEDMALLDHRLGIVNTSWGAIRIGVYTKHLERWFKYFPRTQFHFVSGEQLIANPAQVMEEVQSFLGLRQFITDKHFYLNAARGFPCLVKSPETGSKPHCLGKTKGRRHPVVQPRVLDRLRDFYRPFNAKFYQMVGKDFGWS